MKIINKYLLKYNIYILLKKINYPINFIINYYFLKKNIYIFFIRSKAIGDNVIVTGLISQFKKNTNSKIYLFTNAVDVFLNNPNISKLVNLLDKPYLYFLFKLLEGQRVIEMNSNTYPYKDIFEKLRITKNKKFNHHLAEVIGGNISQFIDFKNFKNEIYFTKKELDIFQRKFENVIKNKFALIAPFAKETYIPVRNWGHEKFQELVNLLKINWYQANTKNEKKLDNVNILESTTNREFFFLIKNSNFVLANDTSLNHIANCFNIKSFVIMSGFINKEFIEYKNTIIINREPQIECSPCYLKDPCFRDVKYCTEDIKVEKVKEIILKKVDYIR